MSDQTPLTDAAPKAEIAKTSVQPDASVGGAGETKVEAKTEEIKPETKVEEKVEAKESEASPLGKKDEKAEAPKEPIKYELKAPEGMKLDDAKLASFTELGNKLQISPEAAQALLDYHAGEMKSTVDAITKAVTDSNVKAYNDLIGGWKKELDADPDLSGANRAQAQEILGKALDRFFSKEARDAFDMTGAGWNPHVVKGILSMAKALSEGQPTGVGGPRISKGPRTPGSVFYPSKDN